MSYSRYGLPLLLLLFTGIALLYVQAVPLFEHSDEAEHFIYVHTILERGELPVIQSRDEMSQQSDPVQRWNNQAHHAPLYYLLSAGLVSWSERADLERYLVPNELIFLRNTTEHNANKWLHPYGEHTGDTHVAVYTLRLFNLLIGCGTLALIYRAGTLLFTRHQTALLATGFVMCLPTFIVVHTGVTNDALTIFFYTAGITWGLHIWQKKTLSRRDMLLISLILSGIALTKLTGVTLYGVVFGLLLVGAWRGRWSWRRVALMIGVALIVSALLAGWWYLRNWQLYGDPLAMSATRSIWGRATTLTASTLVDDLSRIARSFWFMVGYLHQPVYAPVAFYLYCATLTVSGIGGLLLVLREKRISRILIAWLIIICGIVLAMLLYGTRSVDISYGRLLLPAIAAFACLMAAGWQRLFKQYAGLLLLPMLAFATLAPLHTIPRAYPQLEAVASVPENTQPIERTTGNLELVALQTYTDSANPGDTLTLDLYLRGNHPDNPALLITAADSLRAARLGHMEIYPGMAETRNLPDDTLYKLTAHLPLDVIPPEARPPRVITLLLRWVDLDTNEALTFANGSDLYETNIATLIDNRYTAPDVAHSIDATFGEHITLQGYTLAIVDNTLTAQLRWDALRPMPHNWIPTLQLFDAEDNLITQNDGLPYWYPTSRWIPDEPFIHELTLSLPDDTPPGDYALRVGWYRQTAPDTFERLSVSQGNHTDNLLIIPETIQLP